MNSKYVASIVAISMTCLVTLTAKAQTAAEKAWEKEGQLWSTASVCVGKEFTSDVKRVGIETLLLTYPDSKRSGPQIA